MNVYRISSTKYSKELTASGAENRWNKENEYVIYTGGSRSLSTLELVVHRAAIKITIPYKLMVISIADEPELIKEVKGSDLPSNWRTEAAYSVLQELGSKWYQEKESLVLKVPSALIPQESNFVINTRHPLFFSKVLLVEQEDYIWDARLL
jgi:RES domain-containing protein